LLGSIPHISLKLKQEVVNSIKESGDACFSSFLMSELKNPETIGVIRPVLTALGSCGTKEVIHKLNTLLTEEKVPPRQKRMIKKIILQIKARLGGDFEGWLSHADTKTGEGALSPAEPGTEGGMSIIDESSQKPD
jgi:hypothetical protein